MAVYEVIITYERHVRVRAPSEGAAAAAALRLATPISDRDLPPPFVMRIGDGAAVELHTESET